MDCIQQMRPHKGQIETGAAFRRILEGSEIIAQPKQHGQDPYSFRCIPQVHGATKDAINHVASVLLTEINSVTDNPTIFPDEDLIISGGNFHGQPLVRLEFLPYPHLIPTLFNGCGSGPPLPLTAASAWTWVDHPVSGLLLLTSRPLKPWFRCV